MELITQSPPAEFNFDSASTSPFISAPGSPQPFGNLFYSAPTSPAHVSAFYTQFNDFSTKEEEEEDDDDDDDFEFNFGGQLDKTSLSADELFHGGQIKPFTPSPKLQAADSQDSHGSSPPTSKNIVSEQFEKRQGIETEQTRQKDTARGERKYKGSKSLPRFRISDMLLENGNEKTPDSSTQSKWGWKGWRLKSIFLFRSASEGRVTEKHPLKKYELLKKASEENVKVWSSRPSESVGSSEENVKVWSFRPSESVGSSSKGDGKKGVQTMMSAHEIHYTANRAASEEMKRRTFLPYKQTLLGGCLGFNPARS